MKKLILIGLLVFVFFGELQNATFAQLANTNTAAGVTCPASGSSIEIIASNAKRLSYALNNDSAVDVRVGFLATGTASLSDSNSFILKAGQTYSDAIPGVYYGRVVCMSTTASTVVIHSTQATRE